MRIFCSECDKPIEAEIALPDWIEFVCADCINELMDDYISEMPDDLSEERVLH